VGFPLRDNYLVNQWHSDCHAIAQALGGDNPRFDFARFYNACGWPERYVVSETHLRHDATRYRGWTEIEA
jgi:hypothetical protein